MKVEAIRQNTENTNPTHNKKMMTLNIIISKIQDLIKHKNLEHGDKLPSERLLSEKFGIQRSLTREAIAKLEFYGLVKSIPQSGTFVANIGSVALDGMIDELLNLQEWDFKSLVESRILLEIQTVQFAAQRRTEKDLKNMRKKLDAYITKASKGQSALQEDLLFHLSIARATKNNTLITLMLMIVPEIVMNFERYHVCEKDIDRPGLEEHIEIYTAIEKQDAVLAKARIINHFQALYQYCYD